MWQIPEDEPDGLLPPEPPRLLLHRHQEPPHRHIYRALREILERLDRVEKLVETARPR